MQDLYFSIPTIKSQHTSLINTVSLIKGKITAQLMLLERSYDCLKMYLLFSIVLYTYAKYGQGCSI